MCGYLMLTVLVIIPALTGSTNNAVCHTESVSVIMHFYACFYVHIYIVKGLSRCMYTRGRTHF